MFRARPSMLLALLVWATPALGGEVRVAVATNFAISMKQIERAFVEETGHRILASYASTGTLYMQLLNGAPFDVFLAADRRRPRLLRQQGLADRPFTYAIGRLALWSPDRALVDASGDVLATRDFERLAIANPKTAPYGEAAIQVLEALDLSRHVAPRLVRGHNVNQAFQFVASANVPLGFVALSQVLARGRGSYWIPPQELYVPLHQDAVVLERGRGSRAVADFVAFLVGDTSRSILERYGYELPEAASMTRYSQLHEMTCPGGQSCPPTGRP